VLDLRQRSSLPSTGQVKRWIKYALAHGRSNKQSLKVCVLNGEHLRPAELVALLTEVKKQNTCWVGMLHPVFHSDADEQFTILVTNLHQLDLHAARNAKEAKLWTESIVQAAARHGRSRIRVITGRGKHANANGQRGVLFQALPGWLKKHRRFSVRRWRRSVGMYNVELLPGAVRFVRLQLRRGPWIAVLRLALQLLSHSQLRLSTKGVPETLIWQTVFPPLNFLLHRIGCPIRSIEMSAHPGSVLLSIVPRPMAPLPLFPGRSCFF
jgi:hypothetical protein